MDAFFIAYRQGPAELLFWFALSICHPFKVVYLVLINYTSLY